jgi:hypothetical protein
VFPPLAKSILDLFKFGGIVPFPNIPEDEGWPMLVLEVIDGLDETLLAELATLVLLLLLPLPGVAAAAFRSAAIDAFTKRCNAATSFANA